MHTTGYECNTISVRLTKTPPIWMNSNQHYHFYCDANHINSWISPINLHCFSTKLRSNLKLKPSHLWPSKLKFLKNSKCMSLLESHKSLLCHQIIKIAIILSNFRFAWKLIFKLSTTHYITSVNFIVIR